MRVHARIGKLSVPTHVDDRRGGRAAIRGRVLPAIWGIALALLWLIGPAPVQAANTLVDPGVTPGIGTTATLFELTVTYASSAPTLPSRAWAVVPGGAEVDLVTSDTAPPATYRASTTLPAGDLTITFRAMVQGSPPSPVGAQVTVTPQATPTPAATPTPIPSEPPPPPTVTPSTAPASPAPSGSPLPTAGPTVPPAPGVTPGPVPPAPPRASPGAPSSAAPEASGAATESASPRSGSPETGWSQVATVRPEASGVPDIAEASDESGPRGGLGQMTLVALGSATSVAGAAILARQWRVRAAARRAPAIGAVVSRPARRYPPRR